MIRQDQQFGGVEVSVLSSLCILWAVITFELIGLVGSLPREVRIARSIASAPILIIRYHNSRTLKAITIPDCQSP
jgi:hypothetical protein